MSIIDSRAYEDDPFGVQDLTRRAVPVDEDRRSCDDHKVIILQPITADTHPVYSCSNDPWTKQTGQPTVEYSLFTPLFEARRIFPMNDRP